MTPTDPYHLSARRLLALALLALSLRLAWAALVPVVPVSDSHAYDTFAGNIASGVGMAWEPGRPTAYWPVGTPAAYALLYTIFGHTYTPILALNAILGCAITLLAAMLGARWFGRDAGTWAGVFTACWPWQIQFTTILASELQFTFLVLLGTWLWIVLRDAAVHRPHSVRLHLLRTVAAGLVFGLGTLVRPTALLLPIVLGGIEFLTLRHRLRTTVVTGVTLAVLLATISPWALRNSRLYGELVLVSTNGGVNLWMGNNPDTTGAYQKELEAAPGMNEAAWNRMHKEQAVAFIKQDPLAFVKRSIIKAVRLHDRETIGVAWNKEGLALARPDLFAPTGEGESALAFDQRRATKILKLVSSAYWYAILSIAFAGILLLPWRSQFWLVLNHPALVLWAYFTAVHAVIVVQDRYHFPSTPMVATLAGLAAATGLARLRRGRRPDGTDAQPSGAQG